MRLAALPSLADFWDGARRIVEWSVGLTFFAVPFCFFFFCAKMCGLHFLVGPVVTLYGSGTFLTAHVVLFSSPLPRTTAAIWLLAIAGLLTLFIVRALQVAGPLSECTAVTSECMIYATTVGLPVTCLLINVAGFGYIMGSRSNVEGCWWVVRAVLTAEGVAIAITGMLHAMNNAEYYPPGHTSFSGCIMSAAAFVIPARLFTHDRRARIRRLLHKTRLLRDVPTDELLERRNPQNDQTSEARFYRNYVDRLWASLPSERPVDALSETLSWSSYGARSTNEPNQEARADEHAEPPPARRLRHRTSATRR